MTTVLGHLGFSYIGLIYLLMLWVPNILWARRKPRGYDASGENRLLLVLERVGQVLCTATILCFSDYNPHTFEPWILWLCVSFLLMVLYEAFWIRYFCSEQTVQDFYRSFAGVSVPGATLPVVAFFLLGIYGKVIWFCIAVIILGIGHIGIHVEHVRKLQANLH